MCGTRNVGSARSALPRAKPATGVGAPQMASSSKNAPVSVPFSNPALADSTLGASQAAVALEAAPSTALMPLPGRPRPSCSGTVTLRSSVLDDASLALREPLDADLVVPAFEESIRRLDAQAHAIQVQKAALLAAIARAQGTAPQLAPGDEEEGVSGPSSRKRGRS